MSPLALMLWILRRNEQDVVDFYNFMTPFVFRATHSNMLNFGYWNDKTNNPSQAQYALCSLIGEFARLESAKKVLDVGSGFSGPALHWKSTYDLLDIVCINTNLHQLTTSLKLIPAILNPAARSYMRNTSGTLSLLNSTAAVLPIADHSVDRVIALESAQHFKSLRHFVRESRRVLKDGGLFIIAIPVIGTDVVRNPFTQFLKLGVLSFTWASEHYHLEHVQSIMKEEGFIIEETRHIGSKVFEPLTDYCIKNRRELKHMILNHQTPYLESILYNCVESIIYKSALKMKELSKKRIIDYAMIKGRI